MDGAAEMEKISRAAHIGARFALSPIHPEGFVEVGTRRVAALGL